MLQHSKHIFCRSGGLEMIFPPKLFCCVAGSARGEATWSSLLVAMEWKCHGLTEARSAAFGVWPVKATMRRLAHSRSATCRQSPRGAAAVPAVVPCEDTTVENCPLGVGALPRSSSVRCMSRTSTKTKSLPPVIPLRRSDQRLPEIFRFTMEGLYFHSS